MKKRKNKINITNYQESLFNKYEVDESYLQNRKQRRACLELLEKIDKEKNFNEKKVLKKVINAFKGTELHKKIATCMTITSLIINLQTNPVVADVTSAYQTATQPTKIEQQVENNANVIMDEDSFLQDQLMIEQGVENTSIQLVVKKDINPLQEKNSAFIDEDSELNYYENIKALTVIDTSIEDWEILTLGVEEGEILLLEGEDDPLDMIISKLAEMKEVDSLNIISHGSSGKLHFEDKIISSETLEENREKWETLGKYLTKDGDVQLFGCNVAKGEKGRAFIENLAHITGADVAASINPTGDDELGGDWELESVVGNVEEHNVLKSKGIDKFNHILVHTHDNYCMEPECMGPCKDIGGGGPYNPPPPPSNNAPVFDSGASISINIDENASAQDIKSQLSATDSDGNSLTWSQNSAPAKGTFNVSGSGSGSGSLSPTTATFTPNTNTIGSDSFTVKVTDGTDNDTITVNVSINDVNPTIDDKAVSIDENTPNGTSVTTVLATDDTNGLTYAISSGNTGNAFAINSSTGEITVNDVSKLDYETTPSYTLTIVVDDEDSDSVMDDTANITINLNDLVELDSDGTITAEDGVDESITIDIPTTADSIGEAVSILDFKITDGGASDGKHLTVTSVDIHVSGIDNDKLTYILTNPSGGGDLTGDITGTYSGGKVTFDLSSNHIVVNDGTNETYVVKAYFNDNSGVTDNTAITVSIDGDTDVTVDGSGTQMNGTQEAITNSDNAANMSVAVTSLSFTTQPAGSVSGKKLSTQPVVKAVDAFGNVDKDFTETITLTENVAGTLSGDVDVAAVAGIATFTDIVYTATTDKEDFTFTANDEDGTDSDLSTVDSNSVTSDVVATKLVFTTEPSPTGIITGDVHDFTTDPVVKAVDANDTVDIDFNETVTIDENGTGSTSFTNNSVAAVNGVATFTGLTINHDTVETLNLTANDQDGVGTDLTAGTSTNIVVTANQAPTVSNVNISGTAQVGETLTGSYTYSDVNGDTEGTSTFKWYRSDDASGTNKTEISGATNKTYTLTSTDLEKYISFEVTPVASSGTSPGSEVESSATGGVVPAEAAPVASSVSISGTAQVGETLTGSYTYSDVNGDTEGTSTFKWYRSDDASGTNKTEISGATNKTYTLTSTDLGKYISVEVTPVASSGTSPGSEVESSATGGVVAAEAAPVASSVSISGTAQVGQTLTGSYTYSDVNGDPEGTSTFKWYRSDDTSGTNKTEISGAINKTYTLTSTDLGKYISFEVIPVASSGTSPGSAVESSATGGVVPAEAAPVASSVSISGTAQVGQTLTGSYTYSDVNVDTEGTSTFKWYRSDDASGTNKTEISGATNKTYTLTSTDLGKYISFEVTPVAQSGTSPGSEVESSLTGSVEAAPTYSITAIGNKTMDEKIVGYVSGSQETKDITITKSGTGNLVNLSVALSGTNSNSFEITQPVAKTLDDSETSTSFTVKSKDGLAEGTYTATVTVSANNMNDVTFNVTQVVAAKPLSTDCDVTAITKPSGVTKNGTNITANVAYTTTSSIVDVSVSNNATWKLYSDANCNNEITNKRMNLNVGDNTAYIKVIAENGTTTKTYKIAIKRSVAPDSSAPYIIGTNPTNNTVNVEVYKKIEITFSEKIYIGSKIDMMTLKKGNTVVEHVYGIDDNKLTVNPKIDLDYGTFYTLTIPEQTVTDAVYNSLEDEYVLNFTTEKILSSNADLSRINLSNVSLTPAFNPDQTKYTAGVGYSVNTITITPTKDDNHTKISVNGKEVTSGQASESINLNVGSNTITIVVTAEDQTTKTYTIEVTREAKKDSGSSSSGGSSSSTTPSESESQTGSKVIVNGEEETAGKETIKEENGERNVELVVNSEILNKKIEEATMKEETNNLVEVAVETKDADRVETVLTGDIVKKMDEKEFKLSIKTDEIDYIIPAKEVGIDQVSEILGVKMDSLKDIKVEVQIEKLDSKIVKEIEEKAKAQDYEVVFPPVEFKVVAKTTDTSGEVKSTEISKFSSYVERVMEIPEGVDPSKITTGIVYNADGTFSHIPTEVFKKGDKWFAKLNSLTNSSYSVIWNPITVESVENHWSKEYVNDLASRLVIKNPESFKPDESITRGEFAEYITKAIGVYRTKVAKSGKFIDVEVNNELADAITIAVDYGIIKGYPDGTFRPDGKINREEAMTMYAKAMDIVKLREVDHDRIESYKDKNQVSPWAYDFVKKTISANVFNGRTKETIAPQGTFTYAEAAAAIENLLIESGLINK